MDDCKKIMVRFCSVFIKPYTKKCFGGKVSQFLWINWQPHAKRCSEIILLAIIGVARGGQGRAFALPSLNFALPSKPSSYLNINYT